MVTYSAIYGKYGMPLINVLAKDEQEAVEEVARQLYRPENPSRMDAYRAWVKSGRQVIKSR